MPTLIQGVGALVVRNDFAKEFMTEKSYFGGGTVTGVGLNWVSFKSFSEERFENGSIPFLEIIAIDHGFDYINGIGGWNFVESFTLGLREYAYNQIRSLEYRNGNKLALIYQDNDSNYGPIVSFNLLEDDSNYIGYAFVNKICKINNIHLRTGCFCNPGACRKYLGISEQEYKINHNSKGHVCGDDLDLIDSKPTGAIRISFSISNTRADIDVFISFLKLHFLSEFNQEYPTFKSNLQNIKIIEMNLYPIKSCGAMSVRSWQLSETGFKYDRYWSLVDSLGKTMSLSRHPKMCLIKPISIIDDILCIEIESLRIYISVNSHKNSDLNVVMCGGKNIPAYSNNDPKVSEIFSKFLGVSCTLVSSSKTFQNKSSFLIVSNSSVEVVNLWCNETVTPLRFRPNIVISGFDAFQEDSLVDRKVKIGENIFSIDEICSRCQVVGVDQETATVSNELFSILARRRRINGKVAFGVYARTEKGTNFLNVGDKLILI